MTKCKYRSMKTKQRKALTKDSLPTPQYRIHAHDYSTMHCGCTEVCDRIGRSRCCVSGPSQEGISRVDPSLKPTLKPSSRAQAYTEAVFPTPEGPVMSMVVDSSSPSSSTQASPWKSPQSHESAWDTPQTPSNTIHCILDLLPL